MKIKDLYLYWIGISGLIGFSAGMLFALIPRSRAISESLVVDGIMAVIIVWFVTLFITWEVKH